MGGKPARASYDVKEGDVIELVLGTRQVKVQVVSVQETAAKSDAVLLYRVIE